MPWIIGLVRLVVVTRFSGQFQQNNIAIYCDTLVVN